MILTLYQRDNCHLCDLALDVLAHARVPDFASVFIDHDNEMEARYGERVPVLREESSRTELNWPFDATKVTDFLHAADAATKSSTSGVRQPHFNPQK